MAKRTTELPLLQHVTAPANQVPTTAALGTAPPQALSPSQAGHSSDASTIAILTRDIVVSHLAKPESQARTSADLAALIETTYKTIARLEQEHFPHPDSVRQGAEAFAQSQSGAPTDQSIVPASSAPKHVVSEAPSADPGTGSVTLPDMTATITAQNGDRPARRAERKSVKPAVAEFDTEAWLASFPNPSETMIAEARSDNPNNKRGWIGVYDHQIICLLTGREVKILQPHLRGLFKHHPTHSSFASHAGYILGLRLPDDYPKAAPYLSDMRKKSASKRGTVESGRSGELQKKIDEVLAKTGFDLTYRTKPGTRPGNFPDFVVCLECGAAMHDIRQHLREVHGTNYDRYKREWKISGRAPANSPEGMDFVSTRKEAARLLAEMNIAPSAQIEPERWPGVLEDAVLCLMDGQLVPDLERHLGSTGLPPLAHYLARYELPSDYPVMVRPRPDARA
ncbi:MucR family transcriptional regulator [Oscillatoria laete-virens NRMC-F 0139]|nr:MucR family transcriptional regulator [Oscillatoria laete-virens]MDL5054806.1 MucR family transcriptional regulator [Oscillatoria laete-virens NRMC-F 0139]